MCSSGGATVSTRQSPPAAGHDWAAELLAALLDGELDETTAAAVTAHVQECAECSRDWAELRATKQLLAALPAARAPRSYAILADDLAEPGRAGATFWPRLLGLTWRLSGALAVVIILIGTMQLAGINLGGEAETQYIQAEPQAAPARPAGELGATELPAAQQAAAPAAPAGPRGERAAAGAAGPAGQTIVVEKERPVVVEKVVERVERPVEKVVEKVVAVEKIVGKQVVAADAARAPAPTATRTATPTPSPTATATTPPTATPAIPQQYRPRRQRPGPRRHNGSRPVRRSPRGCCGSSAAPWWSSWPGRPGWENAGCAGARGDGFHPMAPLCSPRAAGGRAGCGTTAEHQAGGESYGT